MRFVLSQSGLKSVITSGIFSLVAIGILFNWAVPVSAQNAVPIKPDAPTLLALAKGMVEVDWNDVSGANGYEVQFYTSSGWIDLPNAGLGIEIVFYGSRAVATSLPEDMGYDSFRVRAGNSVGWSEWSEYAWQMTTHNMEWEGVPATGAPAISGTAQVGETLTASTSGIADADGLTNVSYRYQWIRNDVSSDRNIRYATGTTYTLVAADEGQTIKVKVRFDDDEGNEETLTSAETDAVAPVPCPGASYNPTPTDVEVDSVPIVVASTTDDYFVLYVRGTTVDLPVLVKRGEAGTTTLAENVKALTKERYRVEKYLIADPADVDGDCIDDITELDDLGTNNPVNAAGSLDLNDGAVGIPDPETFEVLARDGEHLKFVVFGLHTKSPRMYFHNTSTHPNHMTFLEVLLDEGLEQDRANVARGYIDYHPSLEAADGSPGVYVTWDARLHRFRDVNILHTLIAANMLLIEQDLVYLFNHDQLLQIQHELPLYETSRIPLIFHYDLWPEANYVPLNEEVGFGLLRVLEPDERPSFRDVVIYETLPNNLPRVAGIISTVPQTPLSHVNLRAVQDGIPNAFIRGATDSSSIAGLIGSHVRYEVSENGYTLRAATRQEVDAHYESSRPATSQTPQRDLSVTEIRPLSEIGFDDWDAFGVKAANVAVLGTFGFPEGTVPDGFAIPFYFYDEFMKHNDFYTRIETMLADADFQENFDTQDEELKDLRDAIEDGETPAWILTALADMNTGFPQGTTNRKYRSSTNNEDLPGFNGAGLYDSKSQKPDEDEEDGLDKSLKEVYASLWTFRAFTERDFHRIDHLAAAMGILVHPSYQDELVNGVAVSFKLIQGVIGWGYYVNSQVGEDLVTNPEAHSVPEELLLYNDGSYRIVATSNQVAPGELLMSSGQIGQLRRHLQEIHNHFKGLYNPAAGEPFAMEIEFKITSENKLAIKQARPWVFSGVATAPPGKTLPSAPINLAVAPGDTSLTVVWDLPANTGGENPTAYDVRYIKTSEDETDDANWTEQLRAWIESSGVMSYPITDLETGEQYDVQVRAENSVGKGSWSASETGTPTVSLELPSTNTAGVSLSKTALTVMEEDTAGGTYTVVLDSQPMTDVEVTVAGHAGTEVTPNPTTLTFTGSNWETVQTVTVSAGADADTMDGAVTLTHSAGSTDSAYSGITIAGVTVTVNDNDTTNTPATGAPTISGTAQVGGTLTADTSRIADADGLTNVNYGYQWISSDGTTDTDISGETDAAYTLVADDVGRTIKVRVTFTDDAENETTLTSTATDEVDFAVQQQTANNPATGSPTISGTAQVGEMLTADTSGITDTDGLTNVTYSYQWLGDDTDIAGATSSTYTLVADDEGQTIKVRVIVTDDAENETTLTSTATAVVAAPEPPAMPTGLSPSVSHDDVTLTWDDPQDDSITGYVILRRDRAIHLVGTFVTITGDTGSADTTYTDDTVEPDKQYVYRIKAINEHGEVSEESDWVRGFTPAIPVPDKPTGLSPSVSHDTVTLTWDDPQDDAITGYVILRRDREIHPEGTFVTITGDTGSTETTYTDDTVEPDKQYVYRIKAINEHGKVSERSHWVRGFTPAAPPTDSPATGQPTITGTAQVGEELTADTSGITDTDGLVNATYSYQWVANDGTTDTDISGATDATYTLLADDEGQTIKVRVIVTDDAENETTLTSAATEAVAAAPQPDSPATGRPTISGTAQVGEELTADTSGIADTDGLTNAAYSYQWLSDDAEIGGATDSTYTLVDDDEGQTIKVRVTVTDDAENETTLTSAATEAVAAAPQPDSPATGQPTISGTAQVGEELTADTSGIADTDGLTNAAYSYQWLSDDAEIGGATDSTYTLVDDDEGQTIKVRVTVTDDAENETTLTSAATEAVAAAPQPDSPATGQPTISGTAQVGEELTADTSGIADTDGLTNAAYSYQWLSDDAEIGGATDSTYTLVDDDEGQTIMVRVTVTDDAENETTLTSAATEAVAAAPQPDSPATGQPTISGTAQVGEELTADTSGIADTDGLTNAAYSYQWLSDDAEIGGATDSTYTLVDDDEGQTIKVRVTVTDDAENETTLTSAATEAVAAAPQPDSPATGQPTISGTAQVGEELTADTSGIADTDGLTNAVYSYQWLSGDAEIGGATGSTYTLLGADEGQTIKVRVIVTDDLGNETTLTSAATTEVAPKPNTPATGEPTISGTVQVSQTLTADTSAITDADGLTNVSYSYQWVVTDGGAYIDISGETGATYTLVSADRGLYILVRVSFTDDAGKRETLTSAATEAVAAAP